MREVKIFILHLKDCFFHVSSCGSGGNSCSRRAFERAYSYLGPVYLGEDNMEEKKPTAVHACFHPLRRRRNCSDWGRALTQGSEAEQDALIFLFGQAMLLTSPPEMSELQ